MDGDLRLNSAIMPTCLGLFKYSFRETPWVSKKILFSRNFMGTSAFFSATSMETGRVAELEQVEKAIKRASLTFLK